jgi:hypothetical protein
MVYIGVALLSWPEAAFKNLKTLRVFLCTDTLPEIVTMKVPLENIYALCS